MVNGSQFQESATEVATSLLVGSAELRRATMLRALAAEARRALRPAAAPATRRAAAAAAAPDAPRAALDEALEAAAADNDRARFECARALFTAARA
jgi:hypothetical protein